MKAYPIEICFDCSNCTPSNLPVQSDLFTNPDHYCTILSEYDNVANSLTKPFYLENDITKTINSDCPLMDY